MAPIATTSPPTIHTVLLAIKTSPGFGKHSPNDRSAVTTVDIEKSWYTSKENRDSAILGRSERCAAHLMAGHQEGDIHSLPTPPESGQRDRCPRPPGSVPHAEAVDR